MAAVGLRHNTPTQEQDTPTLRPAQNGSGVLEGSKLDTAEEPYERVALMNPACATDI